MEAQVTRLRPARSAPVLEVEGLTTVFSAGERTVNAVDDVSLWLRARETLAIVGESGCGKSTAALSIMRLIPDPPGKIVAGEVRLDGRDLLALDEALMRDVRGNDISMIFQEPLTSLNPVLTVGSQIAEAVELHQDLGKSAALEKAVAMLALVKIPEPAQRAGEYPHQMSGGMRQRAMIAMALACNPKVLIADEPTSALDVTVQAEILALIQRMRREEGISVLFVSHDLAVVAGLCDRVAIMQRGRIVESGETRATLRSPVDPYTRELMAAVPRVSAARA
jgi:peptide/nickel transport system ATP-binding protein